MQEILIVDDERVVREGLKRMLLGEGFAVRTARDGEEALARISEKRPGLVLLDVMMPKMNGFRCCEEIRRQNGLLPVIFLTAKDSEADQVRGIDLGADGFVSKGAGENLLLASIRRALQRTGRITELVACAAARTLRLGNVVVDFKTLAVNEGEREIARLTKSEADLLKILEEKGEMLVETNELIAELRGQGFACEDTMLYMHVSNLRRKLGSAADKIVNRRGAGYCLVR